MTRRLLPDSAIVDQASENDREWFAEHSGRRYRLRPAVRGEFESRGIATHALVTQVQPGFRIRNPMFFEGPLPLDTDVELERVARIALLDGRYVQVNHAGHVAELMVHVVSAVSSG